MLERPCVGHGCQRPGGLHQDSRAAPVPQAHRLGIAVERRGDDAAVR